MSFKIVHLLLLEPAAHVLLVLRHLADRCLLQGAKFAAGRAELLEGVEELGGVVFFGFQLFWALAAAHLAIGCCGQVGRAVLTLQGGLGLAFLQGFRGGAVSQGSLLVVLVPFVDTLHLGPDAVFVGELEVPVNEALDRCGNQVLVHQRVSELLLIIAELVLVEVELVVGRDVGRGELLREHIFRVYAADPRMEQHLLQSLHAAQSQLGVFVQQSGQQTLDLTRQLNMVREGELFVDDGLLDLLLVPRVKRRKTCDQLVEQCSQGIEVHSVAVTRLLDHLRRHVLSAAAEAIGNFPAIQSSLRQPKICDLHVSIMINEQILRLEIPIDDILLMEVHESVEYFNEVESSIGLGHPLHRFQVVEQFSARTICIRVRLHSSTKHTKWWVSKQWFILTTKGWFSCAQISFSFSTMFSFWFSQMNCFSITFIAQNWPSLRLRTRYTLLNPPIARHLQIWYFFSLPSPTNSTQLKLIFSAQRVPSPMEILQSSSRSRCADSNPTTSAVLKTGLLSLWSVRWRQMCWWKRKGRCLVWMPTGSLTLSEADLQLRMTEKCVGELGMEGTEGYSSRKWCSVHWQP